MNLIEKFTKECQEKVRVVLKSAIDFDDIEFRLSKIPGISNVVKNDNTISPLDINYEFEHDGKSYILRGVAINYNFTNGNCNSFPGVLQLHEKDVKPRHLDNLRKRNNNSLTIYRDLGHQVSIPEYAPQKDTVVKTLPKYNNMPIIPLENLEDTMKFWLNNSTGLDNRVNYLLEDMTKEASNKVYELTENFLMQNKTVYTCSRGINNRKNFQWYNIKNLGILSPLTYNDGGIYK